MYCTLIARVLAGLLLFILAGCSGSGSSREQQGAEGCSTAGVAECRENGFVVCGDFDLNGTLEWSALQSCPQGQSCSVGQCTAGCTDECPAQGAGECRDRGVVTCGNFDADSCLEWSAPQSCPDGQSCSGGQCVAGCADECPAQGAGECRDGGVVTCGNFDADSCLEWSAPQSCPQGQTCLNGQCRQSADPIWRPRPGTSWQWQLTGTIDQTVDTQMFDIDLFDTPVGVIEALHGKGKVVICYFSAGSREDWRPDADQFPSSAIGNSLAGWPGEKWIDIRNQEVREIMKRRLDLALAKGCDGVEPDNIDGYANNNGFGLSFADQLNYNRFLAKEAHDRRLSIGLKNDLDQVRDLVGDFDWALNEECFAWDECNLLLPFIEAGKAVFQVEYGNASLADSICPKANGMNFDAIIKNIDLDAWRISCR